MTKMLEVPSYSFRANNAVLECLFGLKRSLASTKIHLYGMPFRVHCNTGSLSVRQLKQEPHVKTSWNESPI